MNAIDSSAWLEYFADRRNASFFAPPVEDIESPIVPTLVLFEVIENVLRQRGEDAALRVVAAMQLGIVIDLDAALAINAGRLGVASKLPMADSVILATARQVGPQVWTQNSDLEGIECVQYRKWMP